MSLTRIDVVVGVIFNAYQQVLVAQRHFAHQGICWEFPGGKIEPGESEVAALKRELFEEVGIIVIAHLPWLVIDHDYVDKAVSLKVHKITAFEGQPKGCEGQKIQWLAPSILSQLSVPKANERIVQALLPHPP